MVGTTVATKAFKFKGFVLEDIGLFIIRDPLDDGGRDRLAMQVLLRFHKSENNETTPTFFPFLEETLAMLCPPSHRLAKALAEKVVDWPSANIDWLQGGIDWSGSAAPFFSTRLSIPC